MWCFSDVEFKHFGTGLFFGEGDEDTTFKTSTNRCVELPGDIGCSQHENSTWIVPDALKSVNRDSWGVEAGGTFIWTRNSVFTRREASLSPSPLVPQMASTSSMNIIDGLFCLAIVNSCFTSLSSQYNVLLSGGYRSLSPIHFEIKSLELTEKNVEFASVATAFAKYDLPVPGGP
jgi:hypothetical protein